MDIYSVICSAIGTDIYGKTVIRLDRLEAQRHADGGGYIKVHGTAVCEGTYAEMLLISGRLTGSYAGVPVIRAVSAIRIDRRTDDSARFSQEFEAVLPIPHEAAAQRGT